MALKLITHISIIFKVKILISDKITVLRLGGKFITLHFFGSCKKVGEKS